MRYYAVILMAIAIACLPGCGPEEQAGPTIGDSDAAATAQSRNVFIVDREPMPGSNKHMYHRPDCPQLPPPERRAEVEPAIIRELANLHQPCPVCKPTLSGEEASDEGR
jgi:hypothetical protein